jgi:hypothetical protein
MSFHGSCNRMEPVQGLKHSIAGGDGSGATGRRPEQLGRTG